MLGPFSLAMQFSKPQEISADHERGVLALAFRQSPRLHPVIGTAEQGRVVIIDVLVADEGAQQFVRTSAPLAWAVTW